MDTEKKTEVFDAVPVENEGGVPQKEFDLMHEIYSEMLRRQVEFKAALEAGKSDEEIGLLADTLTNETYAKFHDRLPEGIREDQKVFAEQIKALPESLRERLTIRVKESFLATTFEMVVELLGEGRKPTVLN